MISRTFEFAGWVLGAYNFYKINYDRSFMSKSYFSQPVWSKYYFDGGKYEIEPSGNIQRIYLDGSPYTASVVLEKVGSNAPQIYYVHRDYLGSITQVTDNSANLVAEYSYDAWGRMRNVSTWQPYAQGSQPALRFGRGYTGHEHLNDYGLINMNARLYDPVLGRFYEPDPFVNSGLSNDFNRYVYCRNNPLMYTDINGMSFKDWWKRNIAEPFMREWHDRFGNGQGGWEVGYNSAGGFFTNPTYNGTPWGASAYYNPSNRQMSFGNGSAGFHDNSSSVRIDNKIAQSVVQAENNAKGEYLKQRIFEANNDYISHIEFGYSVWIDNMRSVPKSANYVGGGLTTLTGGLSIYQAYDEYQNGEINPIDAASATTATAVLISKGASWVNLGGKFTAGLGTFGEIGAYSLMIYQLWNSLIYKPMRDLNFAPSYYNSDNDPYYGDPYFDNPANQERY